MVCHEYATDHICSTFFTFPATAHIVAAAGTGLAESARAFLYFCMKLPSGHFVLKGITMKKIILIAGVVTMLLGLAGCNTVQGVGQDVQAAGSAIKRAAQ